MQGNTSNEAGTLNEKVELQPLLLESAAGTRPSFSSCVLAAPNEPETPDDFSQVLMHRSGSITLDVWLKEVTKCNIRYINGEGNTLLHFACDKGIDAVKKCVEMGADVNVRSTANETPLAWGLVNGDIKLVKVLLDADADCHLKIKGINFLHVAARSENQSMLFFLLRYKPELQAMLFDVSSSGFSVLHYATKFNYAICAQYLIEKFKLDVLKTDNANNVPMHIACNENSRETLYLLLKNNGKSQLNQVNERGQTPQDLATTKACAPVIKNYFNRENHMMWSAWDKCTNDAYRYGISQFFPKITAFFFISQAIAISHMWFCMSHYLSATSMAFLSLISVFTMCLYINLTRSNPGFIPKRKFSDIGEDFDRLLFEGSTKSICVSCGIVRPWRSKHSRELNRCVERFDHYCPWLGNVVGINNQFRFLLFAVLQPIAQGTYIRMVWHWIRSGDSYITWTGYLWGLFSAAEGTMMTFYGIFMTGNIVYLLSRNLTTNDQMNGFRYDWYTMKGRSRSNLFDMGILTNWYNLLSGNHNRHKAYKRGVGMV